MLETRAINARCIPEIGTQHSSSLIRLTSLDISSMKFYRRLSGDLVAEASAFAAVRVAPAEETGVERFGYTRTRSGTEVHKE